MKDSAYSIKSVSADAVVACVMAGCSVLCMAGAVVVSYRFEGRGPAAVGLLGIGGLLFAMLGIVFTVSAWKSPDGGLLMKRIAGIINGILFGIYVLFYILGRL